MGYVNLVTLTFLLVLTAAPVKAVPEGPHAASRAPLTVKSVLLYGEPGTGAISASILGVLVLPGADSTVVERPRPRDPWFSFDKVQHFTFSFLFTVGGQYTYVNKFGMSEGSALPVSIGTAWTIGLLKELYDWRLGPRRYFSERDLIANSVGILAATLYIVAF